MQRSWSAAAECSTLLVVASLSLLCITANADQQGEDRTCPHTIDPVCGSNSVTYGNQCLAKSQGLESITPGICKDDKDAGAWVDTGLEHFLEDGRVGATAIHQFADEGFHYVYSLNLTGPNGADRIANRKINRNKIDTEILSNYRPGLLGAVRVTSAGHVYEQVTLVGAVEAAKVTDSSGGQGFGVLGSSATGLGVGSSSKTSSGSTNDANPASMVTDAYIPPTEQEEEEETSLAGDQGGRRLRWILGSDDRREVSDTAAKFPFHAVGQLKIRDISGNSFTCSGALVGKNAVLTAAHCVYDSAAKLYYREISFIPGLNAPETPYAPVKWRYATTFREYRNRQDVNYDIAIITLQENIGQKIGWLGFAVKCGPRDMKLMTMGYPSDKGALGTAYVQKCDVATGIDACKGTKTTWDADTQPLQQHYCDSAKGQSGASMWDSDFRVRMVLNAESEKCEGGCENYGVLINPDHYRFISKNTGSKAGAANPR